MAISLDNVLARQANRRAPGTSRGAFPFLQLAARLNSLEDDSVIVKESIDTIGSIIRCHAALCVMFSPCDIMYSRFWRSSPLMIAFEQHLREMGESLVSSWRLPRHTSGLVRDGILALPIMWRGRVIGLIAMHTLDQRITRAQKEGLLTTCHHLAAIFGMKHFAKGHVRAAESKVPERDITHAIALQQSLQPALPHVVCGLSIAAHSRPAYYVGGDYYDLITVGSGQLGIVIADVEGKGVSGALFGNLLRTTVHFLAKESPSPADVFNRISSVLYKEPHPPQMFFTMFYAVYDQEQRTLRYASSGHVPPVIIRSRRSDPERLPCDGALLTTGNAKPYQEHATALMPGDVLALYTDGLTEQRCRDRMPFGEERLLELLRSCAASDAETILTTVLEAHRRSLQAPPDDDLTLIIIKAVPDTA